MSLESDSYPTTCSNTELKYATFFLAESDCSIDAADAAWNRNHWHFFVHIKTHAKTAFYCYRSNKKWRRTAAKKKPTRNAEKEKKKNKTDLAKRKTKVKKKCRKDDEKCTIFVTDSFTNIRCDCSVCISLRVTTATPKRCVRIVKALYTQHGTLCQCICFYYATKSACGCCRQSCLRYAMFKWRQYNTIFAEKGIKSNDSDRATSSASSSMATTISTTTTWASMVHQAELKSQLHVRIAVSATDNVGITTRRL